MSAKEWACVRMAGWEGGALEGGNTFCYMFYLHLALPAHSSHLAQQPPYLITKTLAH